MIMTVTLNPAIDKIVEINNMELGSVHRVEKQVVSLGGKSINVARILEGLECETDAVCFAGKSNFDEINEYATEEDIKLVPVMVEGKIRTNVKVVEPDMNYRTTDINEAGFFISQEKLEEMTTLILDQGKKSEFVVLSGSLPKGVPIDYYKQIAMVLKPFTKVVIDASGEALNKGIEGAPYLIKPNIHELEEVLNMKLENLEQVVAEARKMIETYQMEYVLVSMGEDGSVLVGSDVALKADILPVKVVSTVGAGDSMLAGFIYGLSKTNNKVDLPALIKSLSYGVASSSIAISTQDHVKIQVADLLKEAKDVNIQEI